MKKAIRVITSVQDNPNFAAEIGNDINPDPIAVPAISKTELENLAIKLV